MTRLDENDGPAAAATSSLEGTVSVVTGGNRGIGLSTATKLAKSGSHVAVLARDPAQLAKTEATLAASGVRAIAVPADLSEPEEIDRAFRRIDAELGPVDLLVNNAASYSSEAIGTLWSIDVDAWWYDLRVNLLGTMLCCRAVLPAMVRRGSGRIVNIASMAATHAHPHRSAYACSKAALIRLTDSLAAEVRDSGVSVFSLEPGFVGSTAMSNRVREVLIERQLLSHAPSMLPPEASPDRAAHAVASIASGAADQLTGCFLSVADEPGGFITRHASLID